MLIRNGHRGDPRGAERVTRQLVISEDTGTCARQQPRSDACPTGQRGRLRAAGKVPGRGLFVLAYPVRVFRVYLLPDYESPVLHNLERCSASVSGWFWAKALSLLQEPHDAGLHLILHAAPRPGLVSQSKRHGQVHPRSFSRSRAGLDSGRVPCAQPATPGHTRTCARSGAIGGAPGPCPQASCRQTAPPTPTPALGLAGPGSQAVPGRRVM